jgi:transcriptional regulator of acetoin/glycerol metabolism
MTIDDVAALLSGHASGRASTPSARTLDDIARAILDLPSGGHRLRDVERTVVAHALVQTKGNVSAAARLLGTDRKSLERRIERHKIAVPRGASR